MAKRISLFLIFGYVCLYNLFTVSQVPGLIRRNAAFLLGRVAPHFTSYHNVSTSVRVTSYHNVSTSVRVTSYYNVSKSVMSYYNVSASMTSYHSVPTHSHQLASAFGMYHSLHCWALIMISWCDLWSDTNLESTDRSSRDKGKTETQFYEETVRNNAGSRCKDPEDSLHRERATCT